MPTIKKISLNGVPYDLGGGLTEDVKQASLQIAEKVAYIDEHGQDYYDELYTAFYDNMWNVTNTLANAVNSNSATKTPKDGTYTAIISAATGYTLEGATVSVTMNGANITSSVYNNGTISIPTVTGDVVITVVAVALTVVSISAVYTQSGTVYDTDSLDSLKSDLVVTATFNDSSTEVVPSADYTLSGSLVGGTSTITVEYSGQTTTFEVTVDAYTSVMTDMNNWYLSPGYTVPQSANSMRFTGRGQESWNCVCAMKGMTLTTTAAAGKKVKLSFDLVFSNPDVGDRLLVGPCAWTTPNPTSSGTNQRKEGEVQYLTEPGHYDIVVDVSEKFTTTTDYYLGPCMWFLGNTNNTATVTNVDFSWG